MSFPVRLGTATLAGVFALSAVGAAQAESEDASETPPTTETSLRTPEGSTTGTASADDRSSSSEPTTLETSVSPLPPPPSENTTSESTSPSLKDVSCDAAQVDEKHVLVNIEEADEGDLVELEGVGKFDVNASSQASLPHGGEETLDLVISDGGIEPSARCAVKFSLDKAEPPDGPSDENPEGSENPGDPSITPPDDSPETTDPPSEPAPEPKPEPAETPSSSETAPAASPQPTESDLLPPPPPQPAPSTSQALVEPAPPQNDNFDNELTPPAEPVPQPSQEPQDSAGRAERDIRQHSVNPRHLLSQIWNTDSHNGSGLIMPRPREDRAKATELETLPPVSEDQLDAIKARVTTPDKGNGLDSGDILRADVNERLTHSDTWWLVSSVAGLAILGAGVWWAVARRKPKH